MTVFVCVYIFVLLFVVLMREGMMNTPTFSGSHNVGVTDGGSSSSSQAPCRTRSVEQNISCLNWIIKHHDIWSRLTLSSFYRELEENSLSPMQYERWLVDCTSISMTVLEAATRTSEMLSLTRPNTNLPVLFRATENAEFFVQYAVMNGFDIQSDFHLSHAAQQLIDLLQSSTAPEVSIDVAITAVWCYMLSFWQTWTHVKRRHANVPPHFVLIADFMSRDECIKDISRTEKVLDLLLNERSQDEAEKARKTFEQVVTRACAVLDDTLYMGNDSHVPLCTCGRKGHLPTQCTFKSHI